MRKWSQNSRPETGHSPMTAQGRLRLSMWNEVLAGSVTCHSRVRNSTYSVLLPPQLSKIFGGSLPVTSMAQWARNLVYPAQEPQLLAYNKASEGCGSGTLPWRPNCAGLRLWFSRPLVSI
jgi:hypothetical protein